MPPKGGAKDKKPTGSSGEDPVKKLLRVEKENERLRATCEQQQGNIIELVERYTKCEDELNDLKRSHKAAVDQSKSSGGRPKSSGITPLDKPKQEKDDDLRSQLQQLEQQPVKLAREREDAEMKLLAAEKESKSKEVRIEELEKKCKQLEKKLEDSKKSHSAAAEQPTRIAELEKKCKELEKESEDSKKSHKAAAEQPTSEKLTSENEGEEKLRQENKSLIETLQRVTADLNRKEEESRNEKARLSSLETEIEMLKVKTSDESAKGDTSEGHFITPMNHEDELNKLKEQAKDHEKDKAGLQEKIGLHEKQQREMKTKVSQLEKKREKLKRENDNASKTLAEVEEQLKRAKDTGSGTTQLQRDKEELLRKVDSLEKELRSKEEKITSLQQQLTETEAMKQQLIATQEQLPMAGGHKDTATKKKLENIQEDFKLLNQRYNDLMAHHIKQDVNNFQDINDPLRPEVMVKKVEELEANERNDFLDFVADEKKMEDNDALKLACAVVLEAYAAAAAKREELLKKLMEDMDKSLGAKGSDHEMGQGLRMELLLHLKTRPAAAIYPAIREATLQAIKKQFDEAQADYTKQQEEYLQGCVEVAWLLVLQQPPMTLDTSTPYDDTKHKRFASAAKTDKVLFFVWPTVMTGGSMSRKGTVFTG